MKPIAILAASAASLLLCAPLLAGENLTLEAKDKPAAEPLLDVVTPLNTFNAQASYVFGSRLKDSGASGQRYGEQDEFQSSITYIRRIPLGALNNRLYLNLGGEYRRFDFGVTNAQVPSTLQSVAGVIGLEYIVNGKAGIILRSNPGVYFSGDDASARSFDAPTILAGVIPVRENFKLVLGVRGSLLAQHPVLPIGGFIWDITPKLQASVIAPGPRLIYSFNERVSVFAGAELAGGSFVRDDTNAVRGRINHTVLDYTEYRGGAGLNVKVSKAIALDVSGGYDFQRKFDYYRPGVNYRTKEGAPYIQLRLAGQF